MLLLCPFYQPTPASTFAIIITFVAWMYWLSVEQYVVLHARGNFIAPCLSSPFSKMEGNNNTSLRSTVSKSYCSPYIHSYDLANNGEDLSKRNIY